MTRRVGARPRPSRRVGAEADGLRLVDEAQVAERAGRDEQDVLRVDDHEVVLVPVLRDVQRREHLAALEQLEQRLLDALAADVARAGARARALAAARDLVDLVDEDDAALGELDVLVGAVEQLADHDLDVLAVVAGLGVLGGVGDGERHVEALRERARQVRLARARGADEQHVRLLEEALAGDGLLRAPLEVVVGGDGDGALGALLADDVAVEVLEDLARREDRGRSASAGRSLPGGDAGLGLHARASIPSAAGRR